MAAATEKELVFIDWLKRHGAVLDKLEWPAVDPATGSRGAITRENIEVHTSAMHAADATHMILY